MKYVILLIFALLAACANEVAESDEPVTSNASVPTATPAYEQPVTLPDEVLLPFSFAMRGASIPMGLDMTTVLELLGEPIQTFETPSCAFDGTDVVFLFPGVQIHTIPMGDENFIHTINFRDDTVTTLEGIFIGSTLEDVLAAYSDDYTRDFDMISFTRGYTKLSFIIIDDLVASILYELDVELFWG